jgi:hypothetical protein
VTATYLYCIVKAAKKPSVTHTPAGLPAASLPEVIEVTPSLWIVVADVPKEVYAGESLEKGLADLEWVGRIALAHEAMVEHFSKQRALTVIPLKLFTMFSSPGKAAADIHARRAAIERTMQRIAGAEEWGVRVFRAVSGVPVATATQGRTTSGAAFLEAKKRARDDARAARAAVAEAASQVFDRLSKVARDAHRRTDAPASAATPPLLDAAFLVAFEKRAAFEKAARREADACERAGVELTLTGPWPAYHFSTGS